MADNKTTEQQSSSSRSSPSPAACHGTTYDQLLKGGACIPHPTDRIRVKLEQHAICPKRATKGAAGYDLFVPENFKKTVTTGDNRMTIDTGVRIEIPPGYCGLIKARSSFAKNFQMQILGGVIDSDYRGTISVMFSIRLNGQFDLQPGDRFAQLLIVPVVACHDLEVVDTLSTTERNDGGFGSTGK